MFWKEPLLALLLTSHSSDITLGCRSQPLRSLAIHACVSTCLFKHNIDVVVRLNNTYYATMITPKAVRG